MRRRAALALGIAATALTAGLAHADDAQTSCPAPPPAELPRGDEPAARLERANALAARGEHAKALAAYEALAAEAPGPIALLAASNAARSAVEAGRFDGAEARLADVLAAAAALPDPATRARLRLHAGRAAALLADRHPRARASAAVRAAEALKRAGVDAAEAGDGRLVSFALTYRGELYEKSGRGEEALRLTRRALYAAERASAPDALYAAQWQLARLEAAANRGEAALEAYRDAVGTLRNLRASSALAAEAVGTFQDRVQPLYTSYVDLLLTRARDADAAARQALLGEVLEALEDLKSSELRDYFRDPCLEAQRRATSEDFPRTVLVYPVLLPDRTELIVSRGGRRESVSLPVDRETLTAEVRRFRELLEKRTSRQYLRPAARLYDWLIRPLEPLLGDARTTLVFVPDGALRTIPFGALRDDEKKLFLIEKHPVAVTPSLTLTDPRPIESEEVRLLAAGLSQATAGYPALAAVQAEIAAIRALYPGRTLLDDGFVVESFEKELTSRPFGIVHVASHGEFGGDAADNFLLASDGRLSMDRLASVVGATRFRTEQPLELLTLSACMSAAGDDRAALGLAGVAVRAGARSALATLWSVNDLATADLVVAFYEELREPGRSRAEALQAAQRKLLATREYRHPVYWAAFLLINSWL